MSPVISWGAALGTLFVFLCIERTKQQRHLYAKIDARHLMVKKYVCWHLLSAPQHMKALCSKRSNFTDLASRLDKSHA